MATHIGLGVPIPKMLPVTGTWALPFTAYLIFLAGRVVAIRNTKEKYFGDRSTEGSAELDDLHVATRSHINYLENVPLALLLTAFAEFNGANRKILNYGLAVLFLFRLLHVELGMRIKNTTGEGRAIGAYGTAGYLAGIAAYGAYMVKGWWGI